MDAAGGQIVVQAEPGLAVKDPRDADKAEINPFILAKGLSQPDAANIVNIMWAFHNHLTGEWHEDNPTGGVTFGKKSALWDQYPSTPDITNAGKRIMGFPNMDPKSINFQFNLVDDKVNIYTGSGFKTSFPLDAWKNIK